MANTVINTPELLNLDSTTGATVLAKGTVADRPETPTFSLDYLVVAGGGGGTYSTNPGGGAGGLRTSYGSTSGGGEGAEPSLNVVSGTSFTVTVGAGGPKINTSNISSPSRGGNSVFGTITSLGGGISVTGNDSDGIPWKNGGSGVGGRYGGSPGGQGTTGQGFRGGSINGAPDYKAGGSGGAGGVGLDATGSSTSGASGNGGPGLAVNILNATNAATASVGEVSGSNVYYAGGGGGGSDSFRNRPAGSGGLGGGGNGGYYSNGTNGTANTGGGGGGGANRPSTMEAGDGGSGVVILRYPNSVSATVNGATQASGSPFTEGNDKITVLTSGTGTITFTDSTPTNPDEHPTNGTLRFNTDTNKTEYYDGTGWYEIVDEYASGFIGPATNYFDTKLYTGNGGTQSIGGYINGAASFNGSSSKIDTSLSLDTNNISGGSISFWFNTSQTTPVQILIGSQTAQNGGSYGTSILLGASTGASASESISVWDYNGGTTSAFYTEGGSSFYQDGNWHHLVITSTSSTKNIYIDGVSKTISYTGSGSASANLKFTDIQIGATLGYTGTNYFDGSIDQVRIYNTALSSADVTALYGETAATATTAAFPSGQTAVATYTMDTSANGLLNTQDLSTVNYPAGAGCVALYEMNGNVNDTSGTYNGTPTNITYEGGAFDQAAVFNGSSSYINLNNNTTYSDLTISAWVNVTSTSSRQFIVGRWWDGSNRSIAFFMESGGVLKLLTSSTGADTVTTTGGTLTANTWHFVCFTFQNSGDVTITLDGSTTTTTQNTSINNNNQNWLIGMEDYRGGGKWNGLIDQVRIFNTALTQSQVTTLARGIATSYSGAATNVNFNGHLDFQPDFVWIKNRDGNNSHVLQDSVRGAGSSKTLHSDLTAYEGQYGSYGNISSFDANGFSANAGSNGAYNTNLLNNSYVAWNWKAGGTAVTNNDGTIASQVSANKDSGFSIVKYTGNGISASLQKVGTGLNQECDFVVIKNLDNPASWVVQTNKTDVDKYLYLNDTRAESTSTAFKVDINTNEGTFGFTSNNAGVNALNNDYVAYCWHSVAGYSKIGSYTGNGSSTGPIVYTTDDGTSGGSNGFEPKFIMIKRTDTSGYGWYMMDSARGMVGTTGKFLFANTPASEGTLGAGGLQPNSTGFQITDAGAGFNANLGTYIYMAFA